MRVLLVEDEPAVREELREFLELRGYDVRSVADMHEAEHALRERWWPCALITDFRLPGGSGLDLVRALRRDPELSANVTPIILMTGHTDLTDQVRNALDHERLPMLIKPFDSVTLLSMLGQPHADGVQ